MEESIPTTNATANPEDSLEKDLKEATHDDPTEGRDLKWKSLKDGIWAAAVAEGANSRPRSGLPTLSRTASVRAPQKHPDEQDEAVVALLQRRPPPEEQPMKMSLKALLADGGGYSDDEEGYEGERGGLGQDDEDDNNVGANEGGMVRTCCVCMVRHKGAAFIPCGHTFCRLCSRELWISRGNCPLCNGFILEILDIF